MISRPTWKALLSSICGGIHDSFSDAEYSAAIDRFFVFLSALPLPHRWGLRFLGFLLQWAVWPLAPKLKPFTKLTALEQEQYLLSWQHSRVYTKQLLFRTVKSTLLMQLFASPHLLNQIGYDPQGDCHK